MDTEPLSHVAAQARTVWSTTDAPKDRPIVAIGAVTVRDDGLFNSRFPFCTAIQWSADVEDWMLFHDSPLCLRRGLDEKVVIHHWVDYPTE